jgi:hypothetical protein
MKSPLQNTELLRRTKPAPISLKAPRLVNKFKLGCDPEFALETTSGRFVEASTIGLRIHDAFGCDGSGGPVELRAYPSKFAVEVVASLLNTLRLLAMHNVAARECPRWLTGGYALHRSLGGHMHFGRRLSNKDPKRSKEFQALDDLSCILHQIGYLPGQATRIWSGGYGMLGDIRDQKHGFEYRVFPSWLHTPWFAHMMLTLGKLTVREPEVWKDCFTAKWHEVVERIERLFKAYRYMDDDAALALFSMKWLSKDGLQTPFNFKSEWGLCGATRATVPLRRIPEVIKPDKQAILEVIESIRSGAAPSWREPERTFEVEATPSEPSPRVARHIVPTVYWDFQESYWPRLLQRMYCLKGAEIVFWQSEDNQLLYLAPQIAAILKDSEILELRKVVDVDVLSYGQIGNHLGIGIDSSSAMNYIIPKLSKILPFARANEIDMAWVEKWQSRFLDIGYFQERSKPLVLPYAVQPSTPASGFQQGTMGGVQGFSFSI